MSVVVCIFPSVAPFMGMRSHRELLWCFPMRSPALLSHNLNLRIAFLHLSVSQILYRLPAAESLKMNGESTVKLYIKIGSVPSLGFEPLAAYKCMHTDSSNGYATLRLRPNSCKSCRIILLYSKVRV